MSKIEATNLSFRYENTCDYVFENVSFLIDSTWKTGLIGRNGVGKTTFLSLLLEKYEYEGTINKEVECDYFPYTVQDGEMNTEDVILGVIGNYLELEKKMELSLQGGTDDCLKEYTDCLNKYIDLDGYNIRDTIKSAVIDLGMPLDILSKKYKLLSEGEKTRVLIMALLLKPNHFLLIDEPTNHLDLEGRRKLAAFLEKQKGYIVVSHDRFFLDSCIDHVVSINKRTISVISGNYTTWKTSFDRINQFAEKRNIALKNASDRFLENATKFEEWTRLASTSPSAKKFSARQHNMEHRIENAINERKQLILEGEETVNLKFNFEKNKSTYLIAVQDLTVRIGEKELFDKVNFSLSNGKRIAVSGCNGAGKSSLLKGIIGSISSNGIVSKSPNLRVSYLPQVYDGEYEYIDNLLEKNEIDSKIFYSVLSQLGFQTRNFGNRISEMSQGQRKKIFIAKSLSEKANLYVWDEPLNYLDVICREQLEAAIVKYDIPMILVEHDRQFLENIGAEPIFLK